MAYLRKGFLKAAHRKNHLYCQINSFPFLSFAFTILCLFMVSTPSRHRAVYIDLSSSIHGQLQPGAVREDVIRITLSRDGSTYFRNSHVEPDVLPNRIRDAVLNGAEGKIYLEVDSRARYDDVSHVLTLIQLAGIEKICFLTY
jgi:biopolymer transport protein ExbD